MPLRCCLKWKEDHERCGANSQDSYDEFLNKFIESDEEEDSGICYILFGDKGSNLGF